MSPPTFSVVLPTRNRPELLARAVASVRMQRSAAFELIIVDDGTAPPHGEAIAAFQAELRPNERMIRLPARRIGHGSSFAMNEGVARAAAPYVCFLDDDDEWIDPDYLARASAIIATGPDRPDVIYFQQRARRHDGTEVPEIVWLEGLRATFAGTAQTSGAYRVDARTLMRTHNYCHFNTTVIRRDVFDLVGGLDEGLRYENDRDFYLRCVDAAAHIYYAPYVVSLHNVPNKIAQNNMSTLYSMREKWLYQAALFNRIALTARHAVIRRRCREQFSYTIKKLAVSLAEARRYKDAFAYARLGLAWGSGFAWAGMTAYLGARAMLQRRQPE